MRVAVPRSRYAGAGVRAARGSVGVVVNWARTTRVDLPTPETAGSFKKGGGKMQPVRGLEERPRVRREPPTRTGAGRRTGFGAPFGTVGATKSLPKPFRQNGRRKTHRRRSPQNDHAAVSETPRGVRRPSTKPAQHQRPRGSALVSSRESSGKVLYGWSKPCPGRLGVA
jgi:hypothetical protein